jgi:hypothetical protein
MITLAVDTTATTETPDFGVFAQLADYGPLGLAVLALGYVAWLFIKRYLDETKQLKEQVKSKKTTRKTRK